MISDIRKLEAGAVLESDLCIMGGGAVGVAMGHELSGAGFEVCILEGGGLRLERESQALADGQTDGIPYFPLAESRYRLLGGSTFRWGARSAPLTEFDFQDRAWVPHSGWPLTRADLQPYYDRASRLIGLHGDFEYDGNVWRLFDTSPPPLGGESVQRGTALPGPHRPGVERVPVDSPGPRPPVAGDQGLEAAALCLVQAGTRE